jgi:hypothetical protein
LQARLAAADGGAGGATYNLNLANNGEPDKGISAEGLTIDLVVPAGVNVASATGDGYKGVHMDAQAKANVAEWQVARLAPPRPAPKNTRSFTITLSQPPANAGDLKGTVRWARPMPKTGPNLDVVNFAIRPSGPGR